LSRRTAASAESALHAYFSNVASARYVIRKVFRLIDEQARATGL